MSWWPAAKKLPFMHMVVNSAAAPAAFAIMRPGAGEEPAAYQRRERGGPEAGRGSDVCASNERVHRSAIIAT